MTLVKTWTWSTKLYEKKHVIIDIDNHYHYHY